MAYKIFHSESALDAEGILLTTYRLEGYESWKAELLDDAERDQEGETVLDWYQALEKLGQQLETDSLPPPPEIWKSFKEAGLLEKLRIALSLIKVRSPFYNRAVNRTFTGLGGSVRIEVWLFYQVNHAKRQIYVWHIAWEDLTPTH